MLAASFLLVACLTQTPTTVLLGGQSNAVYLEPYLAAEGLSTVARASTGIGAWHADGDMWPPTEAVLKSGRVRVVVWWQGEADRRAAGYLSELRELVRRMRVASGNPKLKIVVVRVLDKPENQIVRQAQAAFVAGDEYAAIVSTDGLGLPGSDHLTEAGYHTVARRIRSTLSP
jgi:Carbohydrate esterase, sialic acid-specific acetylesterase